MTSGQAIRLAGIGLTVASLAGAEAFYREGLGFQRQDERALDEPALLGVRGRARSIVMGLGAQRIELVEFDPPGRPYPAAAAAADVRFQHFAIVVRDMRRAYERVRDQAGFAAISRDGPRKLPPSSGSVLAFKFRDPDGHPLELLQFPSGSGPAAWRDMPGSALTVGVDHSAIVVADVERSTDFYTRLLGLTVATRSHNSGPAQQRLDNLTRDSVEVVGLAPSMSATPHVELLGYRDPAPAGSAAAALHDIAATRLIFEVDAIAPLLERLREANASVASSGPPEPPAGPQTAVIRDPDGHAIVLVEAFPP